MLLVFGAAAAHADLYRWVDPQSGSVTLSSVPPPASQRGVEVVPYRGPAARPSSAAPALEERWRALLGRIARHQGAAAGDATLQQELRDFAATGAELDRLDPGGAARRRAEAEGVLQRLMRADR